MLMPILLMYAVWGIEDFRRHDRWARFFVLAYWPLLVAGSAYYWQVKEL